MTLGSFILLAGSLSDLFGRKRVFAAGLIGFGVTSLLAAIAPSATMLIVARGLQGVTGALLVPSSLAMIIANFTGPEQGKAIGTWTAWTGISFILGPLLGGALVDLGSWRWVFAINVLPIGATLAVLAPHPARAAPAGARPRRSAGRDPVRARPRRDHLRPHRGADARLERARDLPAARGRRLCAFAGFLVYERFAPPPDARLRSCSATATSRWATPPPRAIYAGLSAFRFLLSVFLQQVAGYPATAAGLALCPVTVLMFAALAASRAAWPANTGRAGS